MFRAAAFVGQASGTEAPAAQAGVGSRRRLGGVRVQDLLHQLLHRELLCPVPTAPLDAMKHGLQLPQQLFPGPLQPLAPVAADGTEDGAAALPTVLQGRDVQVVHKHDVRVLQQPVAAPMECGDDGRVNVAAIETLHALDLQLHVVLARGLPVPPLLPQVAILPVLHLLAIVQDDGAVPRPCLWGTGQPLVMLLKGDQVGCDLLICIPAKPLWRQQWTARKTLQQLLGEKDLQAVAVLGNLGGVLGIHGEGSRGQGHPRPEGPGGGGVCAGKGENKIMAEAPPPTQDKKIELEKWGKTGL